MSETTGAVVAAPTTSLPEDIGGVRNWDYRYCWLRDSVLALEALLAVGYTEEALAFRDFLLACRHRGPEQLQIMYGVGGERRLTEFELTELPGYEGSQPVRVGNAASEQFQLDVYGEVIGVAYLGARPRPASTRGSGRAGGRSSSTSRRSGASPTTASGRRAARGATSPLQGDGLGGLRPRRAARRAVRPGRAAGALGAVRDEIHRQVCDQGYDPSAAPSPSTTAPRELDASVLNIPLVGFLPGTDDRVTGTIDAICARARSRRLRLPVLDRRDRRRAAGRRGAVPGLLVLAGRRARAATAASRRRARSSSDCWRCATTSACSPRSTTSSAQRQVGNFPQAFSHLTLILAADAIRQAETGA